MSKWPPSLCLNSASDSPPSCPHSKACMAGLCGRRRGRRGRAGEPSMNTTDLAPGKSGASYMVDCILLGTLKYQAIKVKIHLFNATCI